MDRRSLLTGLATAVALLPPRPLQAAGGQPFIIGIMGGEIDGTSMRIASDLTSVLNSDTMRVMPIVGKGSLQNLADLIQLPDVDLALIAADVLAYAQSEKLYPGDLSKVQYISKLYDDDVHVCAVPEIQTLSDLQGKPVNIDVEGSGTNLTARAVFKTLGITPDFRNEEAAVAQIRLLRREIAANVYVAGKPVQLFSAQPPGTGLHLVPVVSTPDLEKSYLPDGLLTHADYPTLIGTDQAVETVGVGVTLAVHGSAPGTPRYNHIATFVDIFFSKFAELLKPPHHPRWHDVNLAAAQPGWVRFPPAAAWLAQHRPTVVASSAGGEARTRAEFDAFLAQRAGPPLTTAQREAAWRFFQQQRVEAQ